jgi:hypothetical protein
MKNEDEKFFLALILGFIAGITFFSSLERKRVRQEKFKKIKSELDTGFYNDKIKINNDWINVSEDIKKSYERLKKTTLNEAV